MNELEIRVNPETLEHGGNITGTLAVGLNGHWFPDPDWNDFVVVVLGWWCRSLRALLSEASAELPFMDGSYRVRIERSDTTFARVLLMNNDGRVLGEGVASLSALIAGVDRAARVVLHECRARGWDTEDVEELSDGHRSLAAAVAGF